MRKRAFMTLAASVLIVSGALAGHASAVDTKFAAKGKHGNVYEYDAAPQRAAMMRDVDLVSRSHPAAARMLKTLGSRVIFNAVSEGTVTRIAPEGRGARTSYFIGLGAARPESSRTTVRAVALLAVESSGGNLLRVYQRAVAAKHRRAKVPVPATAAMSSAAFAVDYAALVKLRGARAAHLNAREMNAVVNSWKEAPARR